MNNVSISMMKDESSKSCYYSNQDMQKVLISGLEMINSINQKACGKCAPCRIGHVHMENLLVRMTSKKGKENDLEVLTSLAKALNETSSCPVGRRVPHYVLTSLDVLSRIN